MKKLLAVLPFLAMPIASIAADRASNTTINAAINMIQPGYCENAFMPNTNPVNAQKWYEKTKKIIQNCYEQANKNTSLLPKNYTNQENLDYQIRSGKLFVNRANSSCNSSH